MVYFMDFSTYVFNYSPLQRCTHIKLYDYKNRDETRRIDFLSSFLPSFRPRFSPKANIFLQMYLEHKEHFEGIKFRAAVNIPV